MQFYSLEIAQYPILIRNLAKQKKLQTKIALPKLAYGPQTKKFGISAVAEFDLF